MILQFPAPPPPSETHVRFRRREGGRFCVIATVTATDDDNYLLFAREFCGAVCNGPRRLKRSHPVIAAANDGAPVEAPALPPLFFLPPFYLLPHPAWPCGR
jgi:hypothetical protein